MGGCETGADELGKAGREGAQETTCAVRGQRVIKAAAALAFMTHRQCEVTLSSLQYTGAWCCVFEQTGMLDGSLAKQACAGCAAIAHEQSQRPEAMGGCTL